MELDYSGLVELQCDPGVLHLELELVILVAVRAEVGVPGPAAEEDLLVRQLPEQRVDSNQIDLDGLAALFLVLVQIRLVFD